LTQHYVLREVIDSILILTINRPEIENKLNIECMEEIVNHLNDAEENSKYKVVILTANGKSFCTGGELGDFRIKSPMEIRDFGNSFIKLHTKIVKLSKPVIAAVQGDALGGGFNLLEACDLAVVSKDALFGVPEIRSGLAPMMALAGVSRVSSRKELMELSLLGESIDAHRAKEIGLVNIIVEKDQVLAKAIEWAQKLAVSNPVSIELCKKLYSQLDGLTYSSQLEKGLDILVALLKSDDAKEVLDAIEEKRDPIWSGI